MQSHQSFVFADLAGFTALTEAHGDEHAAEAAAYFFAGVRRLLPDYSAQEVKTIGDAVMIRVPTSAGGVRLAVRLLEDIGRRHGGLRVRIGVHTGPAVAREGDWFGATVNLAARVTAAAEPGEILMTKSTRNAAGSELAGFNLQARGAISFKNVAEPVEILALVPAEQLETAALPVDPLCRMAVAPVRADERRSYGGADYHFCSPECAQIFDRRPEAYAVSG